LKTMPADVALAQVLGVAVGDTVFHSQLVHFENDVPIQFEDRQVNPLAAPDYMRNDFNSTTPTHYLLDHAPLTEASYVIEACLPDPLEAKHLAMKRGEPCLVMTRRTVSGVHVASVARLVYPGLRYSFSGNFQL
jgi:GntR family histidine utilization transcriptional repressor